MEDPLVVSWDAEIPCQWKPPCERAAGWRVTTQCCKKTFLLCTEHKEEKEELHYFHKFCDHMKCGHCFKQPMPMPTFDKL
jgi:hypothetical protein